MLCCPQAQQNRMHGGPQAEKGCKASEETKNRMALAASLIAQSASAGLLHGCPIADGCPPAGWRCAVPTEQQRALLLIAATMVRHQAVRGCCARV